MFNRKMITLARESRGLTQDQLSKKLNNVSQVDLSNYETGRVELNEDVVFQIASTLNFPIQFFKKESLVISRISKFYYRKRNTFPAKLTTPLEATIAIVRRIYAEFLQTVEIDVKDLPKIPVTEKNSPETIAKLVRLFFNLDDGPIDAPVALLENAGIPVLFLDVDSDKFSGLTVQLDRNFPMIVVNKNMPNDHKKFTIAHELGHIIMHIPFAEDPELFERLEDLDTVEKEADRFAGAFLVPEERAKKSFRPFTYSRLTDMKLYWKVSKQSLIFRAKDLGIIDDRKFKSLFIELSRYGERKKEKIDVSIDEPRLLKKIIELFEKELNYSRKDLAENIGGLSMDDFNCWLNLERPMLKVVLN